MCCFTWLIFEQDPRIAGRSGSPEALGLCHFNRKERKMRELTQHELAIVTGGEATCGISIPGGAYCEVPWSDIREWWCENVGWFCDAQTPEAAR